MSNFYHFTDNLSRIQIKIKIKDTERDYNILATICLQLSNKCEILSGKMNEIKYRTHSMQTDMSHMIVKKNINVFGLCHMMQRLTGSFNQQRPS